MADVPEDAGRMLSIDNFRRVRVFNIHRAGIARKGGRGLECSSKRMKVVRIHSDGGCRGNPGPGGWAAVLQYGRHRKEISGAEPATTNNRMELTAAIEALSALKEPCQVEFFTDSNYLRGGITRWIAGWKRNGWRTSAKQRVKNSDLWRLLDAQASRHRIQWFWVKGHSGNRGNERCDQLANAAMDKLNVKLGPEGLKRCLGAFLRQEGDGRAAVSSNVPGVAASFPTQWNPPRRIRGVSSGG